MFVSIVLMSSIIDAEIGAEKPPPAKGGGGKINLTTKEILVSYRY